MSDENKIAMKGLLNAQLDLEKRIAELENLAQQQGIKLDFTSQESGQTLTEIAALKEQLEDMDGLRKYIRAIESRQENLESVLGDHIMSHKYWDDDNRNEELDMLSGEKDEKPERSDKKWCKRCGDRVYNEGKELCDFCEDFWKDKDAEQEPITKILCPHCHSEIQLSTLRVNKELIAEFLDDIEVLQPFIGAYQGILAMVQIKEKWEAERNERITDL